ncbi:MAG: hypothetical protein ACJ763_07595 [Bdellovibrionia bacterium]
MKATFFQKPNEFNLNIEGESWRQGDPVSGSLLIRNHGTEALDASEIRVVLAHGAITKVRKKDAGAFTVVSEQAMSSEPGAPKIVPGSQASFQWKFETDRNCTVTEKGSSLFILYGRGESLDSLGQIQLVIHPYFIIQEYLNSIQTQFRFVLKSFRTTKGWLECKLSPPSARNFASVEQLLLSFRFDGDTLMAHYSFDVKKLEALAATTSISKQKREFEQNYNSMQYLRNGRFNFDEIEASIRDVMNQLNPGVL